MNATEEMMFEICRDRHGSGKTRGVTPTGHAGTGAVPTYFTPHHTATPHPRVTVFGGFTANSLMVTLGSTLVLKASSILNK